MSPPKIVEENINQDEIKLINLLFNMHFFLASNTVVYNWGIFLIILRGSMSTLNDTYVSSDSELA